MTSDDLRARGDRDLAERLLGEAEIRKAVERFEKEMAEHGARRQLLATAMRLTPEMAPDVHATMEACRAALAIDSPVETYVYPAPVFNAAAVRPERGLLFVLLSSSLLEAFEPGELKFVVGHELGHHLFEHHRIPLAPLLGGAAPVGPELALQLFAWQRYAEISSDRAGLACCGGFDPAAHALFKLASGLRGGRIQIRIDRFVSQVGELREEAAREARADEPMRSDWFA
ncbi:MAG: M48 family metallopeptidase, partial [Betaproteobacteria bacterium]|nr:M48 family metallopeptidase [Betaproteobacteria bacterium]